MWRNFLHYCYTKRKQKTRYKEMEKETNSQARQRASSMLTINGTTYDAGNGRQIDAVTKRPSPKTRRYGSFDITPARSVHSGPARSETLKRSAVNKPVAATRPVITRHTRSVSQVATHPLVSHFGRPVDSVTNAAHVVKPSDVLSSINRDGAADAPVGFATQVQNYSPAAMVKAPTHKPSVSKREAVVHHQLKHAPTKAAKKAAHASSTSKKLKRVTLSRPVIITGAIVLVILIGIISYTSVPALSLFVAAKSAGIEASYPNYVPAGYHFSGPVTYKEGEVSMTFKQNGGSNSFTIVQQKSLWDSGAVLDNYVLARSQDYLTYNQGGITVYTFGSQAAWMNAGVLHAIDGSAQLTSEQILRIAGSM